MKIVMSIILVLIGVFMLFGCATFGTSPSNEMKEKFKGSSNYDAEKETFINRRPKLIEEMTKKNMKFSNIFSFFKKRKDDKPTSLLPQVKPNLEEFLKPSEDLKSIWFGHSTFLLNIDGKIVLVDPVFSGSAAPVSFLVKRFQAPVLNLTELPKIDYILISHDHYDHLDMESIKYFKDKNVKFITPLGVKSHLTGWGVEADSIFEKNWWEEAVMDGVTFTATPAQHFSGRGIFDRNKTLWASWVIKSKNHNIYFSGDSGYDTHFKEIGDRLGPFDVAFLESGQYNELWKEVHMLPDEAAVAFKDLKAKKYFPVHWGMFVLSFHSWYEPIEKIAKLAKDNNFELVAPRLGQIVNFSDTINKDPWWESVK